MFNFFKPKTAPYLLLMQRGHRVFESFPVMSTEEMFSIITILTMIAQVNGPPHELKIKFLEDLTGKGIWPINKEVHPLWQLSSQFGMSYVMKNLKELSPNNRRKFFALVSYLIEVDGPPSILEMVYVSKIIEDMGSTSEEYDRVVFTVKKFLKAYPSLWR